MGREGSVEMQVSVWGVSLGGGEGGCGSFLRWMYIYLRI